jgi:hypothetical protein
MCNAISYKENCVGIVLNTENLKFKKNFPILNVQTSVTQLATPIIHTFDTGAPHWWLHRQMREIICVLRTQTMTSFRQTALDRAVGPMGTPVLVSR